MERKALGGEERAKKGDRKRAGSISTSMANLTIEAYDDRKYVGDTALSRWRYRKDRKRGREGRWIDRDSEAKRRKRESGRRGRRGSDGRSGEGQKKHLTVPKHFMSIDLWHKATSYTTWRKVHTRIRNGAHRDTGASERARVLRIKVLLYVLRIPPLITLDTCITSRSAEGQYSLHRYVSKTSRASRCSFKPSITGHKIVPRRASVPILLIVIVPWIISSKRSV